MRRIGKLAAFALLCAHGPSAIAGPPGAAADWRAKTSATVAADVEDGSAVDVLIRMRGDANLRLIDPALSFEARVAYVVERLQRDAEATQGDLLRDLAARGVDGRSLWVANAIAARLPADALRVVAARADVVAIESDAAHTVPRADVVPTTAKAAQAVGANLAQIRAPEAWGRGFRGQGVVVGGQDSGYQWDHPALRARYRGWNGATASHDYNWHDAIHTTYRAGPNECGLRSAVPCDDTSHGSHTMGSVLGDDGAGNQIGVAPDAKWFGCRNMDRGVGRPSTYIECYQFFLAPTDAGGRNPNPALAPHIITNSWGCPLGPPPGGEDCAIDSFNATLANVRAAGILNIIAAGNSGPTCGSILSPPALSPDVFVVGAVDANDAIAAFSSRGPVFRDGVEHLKPDVVAPGVAVRSSIRGSAYGLSQGTSMATPHVAGVAALVMSANPTLRGRPDDVERILRSTSVPLSSSLQCAPFVAASPNAVYGHGRVDALAAVEAALEQDVTSAWSGSWSDPSRSGEGWILEILADGSATMVWFTYPPNGIAGEQHWIIAQGGEIRGREIRFRETYVARGGRFGAAFDPAQLALDPWGTITLSFDDCESGTVTYAGPAAYGSATRGIRRTTALAGLDCRSATPRASGPAVAHTGAWFDPARAGEGWVVETLPNNVGVAYWFTYDPDGRLAWVGGVGPIEGNRLRIDQVLRPVGTRFGAAFDAAAVQHRAWGTLEMTLEGCDRARFRYVASEAGFGSGEYVAQRLARVGGVACTATP